MSQSLFCRHWEVCIAGTAALACAIALARPFTVKSQDRDHRDSIKINAEKMIDQGRQIFRFDTFGDEAFWGGQLRLHDAIAGSGLGGVGQGLTPRGALISVSKLMSPLSQATSFKGYAAERLI